MVYASLTVTPMHDLMVTIAFVFFVVAVSAILHSLYVERHLGLFMLGLVCVSPPLTNAVLYYGNILGGMLPIIQKAGSVAYIVWLFTLYYSQVGTETPESTASI